MILMGWEVVIYMLMEKFLFSIGTPEKHASKNSLLAQDKNSKFGKILEIDKNQLNKDQKVEVKVFFHGP